MIALAALILIVVAGMLLLAMISGRPTARGRRGHIDQAMVTQRWTAIESMAGSGGIGLREAVSEADKLLDYAMRESGFPGQTMGERLKSNQARKFSDLNAVWRAHKLRNTFAHEVGADLVASQAQEAIRDFERGLKDLGAL